MEWQWDSIRDDAFIDVDQIIEKHIGDKLTTAQKWELSFAILDLADRLSRHNAGQNIDQLGESLRRAMGRFRLQMPPRRAKREPPKPEHRY